MLFHVFLIDDLAYLPTVVKLQTGAYMDREPVAVVPIANTKGLRQALLDVMANGNIIVPNPPKDNWPAPVMPKAAGVKTWAVFARRASFWSIDETDRKYLINGYRKEPRGHFVPDRDQVLYFPPEASVDDVVDRMVAILQEAARKDAGK